jgi:hypothetical protein
VLLREIAQSLGYVVSKLLEGACDVGQWMIWNRVVVEMASSAMLLSIQDGIIGF